MDVVYYCTFAAYSAVGLRAQWMDTVLACEVNGFESWLGHFVLLLHFTFSLIQFSLLTFFVGWLGLVGLGFSIRV